MPKPLPLLFIKSDIANRPGLALQDVTDRGGHRTKRWKRTRQDAPAPDRVKGQAPATSQTGRHDPDPEDRRGSARGYGTHDIQPGGRVKFKAGEHEGQGEIVAVGKDGATVKDSEGREHGIHYHELTHYAPSPGQRAGVASGGDKPPPKPPNTGKPEGEGDESDRQPLQKPTILGKQEPISADRFSAADYAKSHDQADVTPEMILAGFPPDTKDRIQAAQDRLKGIEQTIERFKKDGEYTKQREALHQKIVNAILSPERVKAASPEPGEKPTFMILGGRGGSGKSSFKGLVYDPDKFIVLDADAIKGMLPEYEGWNAAQVHEESGEIFDNLVEICRQKGLNVCLDKTMKTAKSAVADVKAFKDAGYRTEAHYMHLPRQEAAKRAVRRFLGGGEKGRYVPIEVVLANTTNEDSFDQVKALVDGWSFRDNNVSKGNKPILISSSQENPQLQKSYDFISGKRIIPILFRRI